MSAVSKWWTILGAIALHALACALPGAVHAYSDPFLYTEPPELGGGGGRWFTGSSADGYGCQVCHQGPAGVPLEISGVPLDGFVPGSSYELAITWPLTVEHLTLIAELTDEQRQGVGTIVLPRPETRLPVELCSGELLGAPASDVHMVEPGRQLVSVIDCGARTLRFQWTAPALSPERVWLDIGFVASDHDGTPAGDAVTMARRPLPIAGQTLGTHVVAQSGCNVRRPERPGSRSGVLVALSIVVLLCVGRLSQRRHR